MLKKLLSISVGVALSTSAIADDNSELIAELIERIDQLERELIDLQDSAGKDGDAVKFKKSAPTPKIYSRDGRSALEFKGRVEIDTVNVGDTTFNDGGQLEALDSYSATQINRLRVGLEGQFARDWEYEIQFDFADNINASDEKLDLKDANIVYEGFENTKLTFGYQKYAFGLENTQSSRHGYMMHRSFTDTFSPDRNFGVQHRYDSDNWAIRTSVAFDNGEDEDFGMFASRIVGTPYRGEGLLHLGASFLYQSMDDGDARWRARPSAKPMERVINTDKFDSDNQTAVGLEFAYQRNNFITQGEYVYATADNQDVGGDTDVSAAYISAIYTITGEMWEYRKKNGTFRQVSPANPISDGGWGAWEVAARIQTADFDDASTNIYGGSATDFAIGLNWYLEKHLKAQFNYIHGSTEYDPSLYEPGLEDDDYNILQARMQFSF